MYSWVVIKRKVPTALITLIILATLALIACDAEKGATGATGSDGMDGVDGTSCLATKNNDSLFINCSGVLDTIVDGSNGSSCTVNDDETGNYLTQTCTDGSFVKWAKALCGGQAYNPSTQFCHNSTIVEYLHTYTQSEIAKLSSVLPTYCQTVGNCGQMGDARDGKIYRWTKICDGSGANCKTWMAENLAYLPSVNANADSSSIEARYYVYRYDGTNVAFAKAEANYTTYGVLYNWTAAMAGSASSTTSPSGVQGACPAGWHLPSSAEWTTLETYVAGTSTIGSALKSTTGWTAGGDTEMDAYGFSALPGGYYDGDKFDNVHNDGNWWTATEIAASIAHERYMNYYYGAYGSSFGNFKYYGFSVRCVQD